jgi:hypothetical protein
MELMPKGFKEFEDYDKACDEVIFENHLEQDIIVITQDQKQKPDIGLVTNGELEQK